MSAADATGEPPPGCRARRRCSAAATAWSSAARPRNHASTPRRALLPRRPKQPPPGAFTGAVAACLYTHTAAAAAATAHSDSTDRSSPGGRPGPLSSPLVPKRVLTASKPITRGLKSSASAGSGVKQRHARGGCVERGRRGSCRAGVRRRNCPAWRRGRGKGGGLGGNTLTRGQGGAPRKSSSCRKQLSRTLWRSGYGRARRRWRDDAENRGGGAACAVGPGIAVVLLQGQGSGCGGSMLPPHDRLLPCTRVRGRVAGGAAAQEGGAVPVRAPSPVKQTQIEQCAARGPTSGEGAGRGEARRQGRRAPSRRAPLAAGARAAGIPKSSSVSLKAVGAAGSQPQQHPAKSERRTRVLCAARAGAAPRVRASQVCNHAAGMCVAAHVRWALHPCK
ncbi:MAG: hypothetical protein J3K34DRAFT_60287 [Monoraphidium minutum]|nr:MAG: hypothetical protein J3K34DRAFT_60287 [Monoraphidium minutum]